MFKTAKLLSLIVETPLHAGSGSELGIVDLPIQREKPTNYPKIEGSSLKGALREAFEQQKDRLPVSLAQAFGQFTSAKSYIEQGIYPTFGPEEGDEHAGALGFTDARLLLFPVKSMKNIFVWITCLAVLERFKRDIQVLPRDDTGKLPAPFEEFMAISVKSLVMTVPQEANDTLFVKDKTLVLEEYAFPIKDEKRDECGKLAGWFSKYLLPGAPAYDFWKTKLKKDIAVLDDNDFREFVTMSTEVIARTKISSETGTVQKGALWYEEYLPADSILYSLVLASPLFSKKETLTKIFPSEQKVMEFFEKGLPEINQIGGNATIGKGLMRTCVVK